MNPVASLERPLVVSAGKALWGFLLSGFLFALLGAILPAWGYFRDPPHFEIVGNYFLCLSAGVILSPRLTAWLLPRRGLGFLLVFACSLSCASLLYLALVPPLASPLWRAAGLLVIGLADGLLNSGLFHVISPCYQADPAGTVVRGGIFYGLGCLAATLLVEGTFYAYTVPAILVFMAVMPGCFAGVFATTPLPAWRAGEQRGLRQALRDFQSPGAVLFALVLFFQFGNEWAIAGWLPLFLIRRLGASPKSALGVLSLYWIALLVGRLLAIAIIPRVRHGRLLLGSVMASAFGCTLLHFTANLFGAGTAAMFLGAGFASIYPLVAERIGRRFPYYHPGFFNGIFSLGLVGGMLAPATLGYTAALWDIGVVTLLPLLGTLMVFVLLVLIWVESKVTGR